MRKQLLYPIFLRIASNMNDTFWKYIYEDMAYGKCPFGIFLDQSYLCCFIKGKEFSFKMDQNNPTLLDDIHYMMKEKAEILSEKEKIQKKEQILNKQKKFQNAISKKCCRDNLLQEYILTNAKKNEISIDVCHRVICFLFVGFLLKLLDIRDIAIQENVIEKIRGIEFHNKKIVVTNNFLYDKNLKLSPSIFSEDDTKKGIFSLWQTFISDSTKFH